MKFFKIVRSCAILDQIKNEETSKGIEIEPIKKEENVDNNRKNTCYDWRKLDIQRKTV